MAKKKMKKSSFIFNIGKSAGYSFVDAISDLMPGLKTNFQNNADFIKNSYQPVKEKFSQSEIFKNNIVAKEGREFLKNSLQDLKSGNFYNKERIKKAEDEAFGGNFNLDDIDDVLNSSFDDMDKSFRDDDDDTSDSSSSSENSKKTAPKNKFFNQNNIIVNGSNGGNKATNMNLSNLSLISNSLLKTAISGFSSMSYQSSKILEFHNNNTVNFYSSVTQKLNEISENTTKLGSFLENLSKSGERKNKKDFLEEFSFLDGFDLPGMFDLYKEKLGINKDDVTGIKDMVSMAIMPDIKKAVANPLGFLMKQGFKAALPRQIKEKLTNFDKTLNYLPFLMQGKFQSMKNSNNFLKSAIGNFFSLDKSKKKLSTFGASSKEVAKFDGVVKRTITNVIPELLSKILASVSDNPYYKQELVYNHDKGKFTTKKRIINSLSKKINNYSLDMDVDDFKEDVLKENINKVPKNMQEQYTKKVNEAFFNLVKKETFLNKGAKLEDISDNPLVAKSILGKFNQLTPVKKAELRKSLIDSIVSYNDIFKDIGNNEWKQSAFDLDFSKDDSDSAKEKIKEQVKNLKDSIKQEKLFGDKSYNDLFEGNKYKKKKDLDENSFFGKISQKIDKGYDKFVNFFAETGDDYGDNLDFSKFSDIDKKKIKGNKNKLLSKPRKRTKQNFALNNKNSNKLFDILFSLNNSVTMIKNSVSGILENQQNLVPQTASSGAISSVSISGEFTDILNKNFSDTNSILTNINDNISKNGERLDKISTINISSSVGSSNSLNENDKGSFFRNVFTKLGSGDYKGALKYSFSRITSLGSKASNFTSKHLKSIFSKIFNKFNKDSLFENVGKAKDFLFDKGGKTKDFLISNGIKAKDFFLKNSGKAKNFLFDKGGKAKDYIFSKGKKSKDFLFDKGGRKRFKEGFKNKKNNLKNSASELFHSSKGFFKNLNISSKFKGLSKVKIPFLGNMFSSSTDYLKRKLLGKDVREVYLVGGKLDRISNPVKVARVKSEFNSAYEQRMSEKKKKRSKKGSKSKHNKIPITEEFKEKIDSSSDFVEEGLNNVSDLFNKKGEGITGKAASIGKGFLGKGKSLVSGLLGKTGKLGSGVKSLGKGGFSVLKHLKRNPLSAVPMLFDGIKHIGRGTVKGISKLGSGGKTIGSGLLKGTGKIFSGVKTAGSGLLGKTGKLGGLLKGAGKLGRIGGKAFLPLTLAMGALDGVKGWKNAGNDFATDHATFGQKLSSTAGGILNGLGFGIPDKLFGKGSTSRFVNRVGKTAFKLSPFGIASTLGKGLFGMLGGKKSSSSAETENAPKGENSVNPSERSATFLGKMSKFFLKGPFAYLFGGEKPGFVMIFKKLFTGIKDFFKGIFGSKDTGNSGNQQLSKDFDKDIYQMTFNSESGGDPGAVSTGAGDYGGQSAGLFQFSRNMGSLKELVNGLSSGSYGDKAKGWGNRLSSVYNNKSQFASTWKQIAKEDSEGFKKAQIDYWNTSTFTPWAKNLKSATGYDITSKSKGVQATAVSTVTQHGSGGALSIFKKVIGNLTSSKGISDPNKLADTDIINGVYDERGRKSGGGLAHFLSSSSAVQRGVSQRFSRERKEALSMAGSSTSATDINATQSTAETAESEDKNIPDEQLEVNPSNFWDKNSNSYWNNGEVSDNGSFLSSSSAAKSNLNFKTRTFKNGQETSTATKVDEETKTNEQLKMDIMKELKNNLDNVGQNTEQSNKILKEMLDVLNKMKTNSDQTIKINNDNQSNVSVPSNLDTVLKGY